MAQEAATCILGPSCGSRLRLRHGAGGGGLLSSVHEAPLAAENDASNKLVVEWMSTLRLYFYSYSVYNDFFHFANIIIEYQITLWVCFWH